MRFSVMFLAVLMSFACSDGGNTPKNNINSGNTSPANKGKQEPLPVYGYEIVKKYPHDPKAFTEGLFYHDGFLYASTGQEGHSALR